MIITYFLTVKYQLNFTYETMPSNFLIFYVSLKKNRTVKKLNDRNHNLVDVETVNLGKTMNTQHLREKWCSSFMIQYILKFKIQETFNQILIITKFKNKWKAMPEPKNDYNSKFDQVFEVV